MNNPIFPFIRGNAGFTSLNYGKEREESKKGGRRGEREGEERERTHSSWGVCIVNL